MSTSPARATTWLPAWRYCSPATSVTSPVTEPSTLPVCVVSLRRVVSCSARRPMVTPAPPLPNTPEVVSRRYSDEACRFCAPAISRLRPALTVTSPSPTTFAPATRTSRAAPTSTALPETVLPCASTSCASRRVSLVLRESTPERVSWLHFAVS
ncbi:hypothetical protein PTE30175_05636 [Pandoraea terrae]|uniref:Uncharacterized protein n=1 Tax=Pandoraea terrae TaxID=1537710 RepID=A0A5E4ZH18_9BURK|nr:hypothetical protein PTE30175_05636 [Pandoraea terrae]